MRDGHAQPLLDVHDLHAFYGRSHVVQGASFHVGAGEIVSLLGRNGVGRSTMLKAIMGDVALRGRIRFAGEEIAGLPSHRIARRGLGYVPESRDVFAGLTVAENLLLGRKRGAGGTNWTTDEIYALFPRLHERATTPAGALSGGEQQLLTICRTLMGNPSLVMIDEPTEGLAPMMAQTIGRLLEDIARRGTAVLLVEQKLTIALRISRRLYVMGHGTIVFEGSPDRLARNAEIRRDWLEV
ncbi:MAG TPA: ABC transporter ATP-binding protein [Stellaceae bacterium]|nr:ABC transporter ATP-binding protein [Stellaceae bacterium]